MGGLLGAKVLWTLEFMGEQPVTELFLSRGGVSWFGGLIGGAGTWSLDAATRADRPISRSGDSGTSRRLCDRAKASTPHSRLQDVNNGHGYSHLGSGSRMCRS